MPRKARFLLVGCIPYQKSYPAFALPVFAPDTQNGVLYVQELDEVNLVVGQFRKLETIDGDIRLTEQKHTFIGAPMMYSFFDETGKSVSGFLPTIEARLRATATRSPKQISFILQVMEILGSSDEKRRARLQVKKSIEIKSGRAASFAFYNVSTLHSALWDAIEKSVYNKDAKRRIIKLRAKLHVRLEEDGVVFDLDAISEADRALIDTEAVRARLGIEFGSSMIDDLESIEMEPAGLPPSTQVDKSVLLRQIKSAGRQEERIAILVSAILRDWSNYKIVFDEYKADRSKFANYALAKLRTEIGRAIEEASAKLDLRELIFDFYSEVFYTNRGYLLLMLSKYLGAFPDANAALRHIIGVVPDIDLQWYGEMIEFNLDKAEDVTVSDDPDLFDFA